MSTTHNTTVTIENNEYTQLSLLNAAMWISHEKRACVRKLIEHALRDDHNERGFNVCIGYSMTIIQLPAALDEVQGICIVLRHWLDGYAGAVVSEQWVGDKSYACINNEWVNLN